MLPRRCPADSSHACSHTKKLSQACSRPPGDYRTPTLHQLPPMSPNRPARQSEHGRLDRVDAGFVQAVDGRAFDQLLDHRLGFPQVENRAPVAIIDARPSSIRRPRVYSPSRADGRRCSCATPSEPTGGSQWRRPPPVGAYALGRGKVTGAAQSGKSSKWEKNSPTVFQEPLSNCAPEP